MAVCLFKQAVGTKPKKPKTARIRIGNILTPLHKEEMDFQNLTLTYAQETEQINGVKCKKMILFSFLC